MFVKKVNYYIAKKVNVTSPPGHQHTFVRCFYVKII